MNTYSKLNLVQLVDVLADLTSRYSSLMKDRRNTDEHHMLKEQIWELIAEIEKQKTEATNTSEFNNSAPQTQDLSMIDK
jgi:hypothetical protein